MNSEMLDRLVHAVLYEGYILYPYRPSVKNHQRWTFGGVFPRSYCEAQDHADRHAVQIECLVEGDAATMLDVEVPFLHLTDRELALTFVDVDPAAVRSSFGDEETWTRVESLTVGGQHYPSWQEAVERRVRPGARSLGELTARPLRTRFEFPDWRQDELLLDAAAEPQGVLLRRQRALAGVVERSAERLAPGRFKLRVTVSNESTLAGEPASIARDEAQRQSLASTHTILHVDGGAFVSLTDPPDEHRAAAAACRNDGAWPVLVGEEGERHTMLASPIILPDYPQIAAESRHDFFDATEIDEMLTLRIRTLTDDEKALMCAVDNRARELLARTQSLDEPGLAELHGAIRSLQPVKEGADDA